jgi:hypothetical protein
MQTETSEQPLLPFLVIWKGSYFYFKATSFEHCYQQAIEQLDDPEFTMVICWH